MFRKSIAMFLLLTLVSYTQAHFIWLIPGDKPNTVKLVFGDKLGPDLDNPDLIDKVKQTGLYVHDPASKHIDLTMTREPGAFSAALPDKAQVIRGKCVYGIFQRGDNPASLLNYYAIYKKGDLKDSGCFHCQPFQAREEKPGVFLIEYDNEPAVDSEVVLAGPDGFKEVKGKTNKEGYVTFDMKDAPKGLYGLRARHIVKEAGEHQGKKYENITNYVTLVFQK